MMSHKPRPTRIDIEKKTVRAMIALYCRRKHAGGCGLCADCIDLLQYSLARLDHCPYAERKPACARCAIHCYASSRREHIRQIMRFAGPRMLFAHPLLAVRHILHQFHPSPEIYHS